MRVSGGPDWMNRKHYTIEAVAQGDPTDRDYRAMLRTQLEERFRLRTHHETQQIDVYALVPNRTDRKLGRNVKPCTGTCRSGRAPRPEGDADSAWKLLNRVLKPAAVKAALAVLEIGKGKQTSAVNFQSLRRTSSTLFGARAKDPKSTQAHMRHADPHVTLKHYQREVPAEVKAAALALERDLLEQKRRREETLEASREDLPII